MHDPDCWPIVFGPGGTQNVPRLRLIEMIDGLERDYVQFESRFNAHCKEMHKLLRSLPTKAGDRAPKPADKPRPVVMPRPIVEKVKEPGKKKMAGLSVGQMGREIERALMNMEPEKRPKPNSVRDIKKALELAMKGRPKEPEKMAQKSHKVNEVSKKAPQKSQPTVPKRVVETKKDSSKTRGLHTAATMADGDDYTVRPMEVEMDVTAKRKSIEKQPAIEQVKHLHPEKKGAQRTPEKSKAAPKLLSLPQFSPEPKPSTQYSLLKRRTELFGKQEKSPPLKRVKTPEKSSPLKRAKSPEKSPSSKRVKGPENAAEAKPKNERCINPMASVYKIGRIKLKTSQAAVKHESSVSPLAQPPKEPNRSAHSSLPSLEEQFDACLLRERSSSDNSNISPPYELEICPSTSTSPLEKPPSNENEPTASPPAKPQSDNVISDEVSDSDGDDDFVSPTDPGLELKIKREVQEAITSPTPVDLEGSLLIYFPPPP